MVEGRLTAVRSRCWLDHPSLAGGGGGAMTRGAPVYWGEFCVRGAVYVVLAAPASIQPYSNSSINSQVY